MEDVPPLIHHLLFFGVPLWFASYPLPPSSCAIIVSRSVYALSFQTSAEIRTTRSSIASTVAQSVCPRQCLPLRTRIPLAMEALSPRPTRTKRPPSRAPSLTAWIWTTGSCAPASRRCAGRTIPTRETAKQVKQRAVLVTRSWTRTRPPSWKR